MATLKLARPVPVMYDACGFVVLLIFVKTSLVFDVTEL